MLRSPLERAVKRQDEKEVERLLAAGEKPENEEFTPNLLHMAASLGNVPIARMMLGAGLDIHSMTSPRGRYTPLHTASTHGRLEMINFLLSRGADLERQALEGMTPFLQAVFAKSLPAVEHLLSLGANIYARGKGKSALEIAKEEKHTEMTEFLEAELEKRKWAGVLPSSAPEAYLLAGGHGQEFLGDRLHTIPAGTTLITVSQCGDAIFKNDMYDSLSRMFVAETGETANVTEGRKEVLLNPLDHLFEIEDHLEISPKTMRIHPEGTPCPNLIYNPLADFSSPGGITILKSGTYKYPIKKEDFFITDEEDEDFTRTEWEVPADKIIGPDLVTALFKESVYPTLDTAQKIFKGVDYNRFDFGQETRVHIYDLMMHLGPGTYYFFACRSVPHFPLKAKIRELAKTNNTFKPLLGNIFTAAKRLENVLTSNNKRIIKELTLMRQKSQELQNTLRKTPKNEEAVAGAGTGGTARRGGRRKNRKTRRLRTKRKN